MNETWWQAGHADDAWEKALANYQCHLKRIRPEMPSQVKKITELCLHDAEVLGFERDLQLISQYSQRQGLGLPCSTAAVLSLKQDQRICSLIYVLWEHVRETPAKSDWPFSKSRKHWLYDEIDLAADQRGRFWHRILFSDGGVTEIPFVSAIINTVTLPSAEKGTAARRSA